jgi:MFS family permease
MSKVATIHRPVTGEPVAGTRSGRWRSLFAMAFAFVSDNTEGGLVNTLFPVIRQALGLGIDALGILTSISRFARMLFGPLWSVVADKYGRKNVLVVVTGLWGLWTAAAGLAQDFTQLLILYSIGVIGTVASEPIANGLLSDMFEEDERGRAYGAIRSIGSAGGLILTPLIGQLARVEDGWRMGLYIMGGISLLSGILILLFVKEPKRHTVTEGNEITQFRSPTRRRCSRRPPSCFWPACCRWSPAWCCSPSSLPTSWTCAAGRLPTPRSSTQCLWPALRSARSLAACWATGSTGASVRTAA